MLVLGASALAVMVTCQTLMAAGPPLIDLKSATHFAILAGSTITSTGAGIINGVLPESSGEKILARIRVRGVRGPRGQGGD